MPSALFVDTVENTRSQKKSTQFALTAFPELDFQQELKSDVFFFFTTSSVRLVRGRPDTIVSLCHRVFFFFPCHFCVLFLDTRGASLPVNDVGLTTASHALLAVVVLEAMSHREVEP